MYLSVIQVKKKKKTIAQSGVLLGERGKNIQYSTFMLIPLFDCDISTGVFVSKWHYFIPSGC